MPLLFSPTPCGLSDLKAGKVCQKQIEAAPEKPATSRLFNARKKRPPIVATTATPPLLTPVAPSPFNARLFIGSTVEQQLPSSYLS